MGFSGYEKKAFDIVDHKLFLCKLIKCGIRVGELQTTLWEAV